MNAIKLQQDAHLTNHIHYVHFHRVRCLFVFKYIYLCLHITSTSTIYSVITNTRETKKGFLKNCSTQVLWWACSVRFFQVIQRLYLCAFLGLQGAPDRAGGGGGMTGDVVGIPALMGRAEGEIVSEGKIARSLAESY